MLVNTVKDRLNYRKEMDRFEPSNDITMVLALAIRKTPLVVHQIITTLKMRWRRKGQPLKRIPQLLRAKLACSRGHLDFSNILLIVPSIFDIVSAIAVTPTQLTHLSSSKPTPTLTNPEHWPLLSPSSPQTQTQLRPHYSTH